MLQRPFRSPLALLALLIVVLLGRAGWAAEVPLSADQMVQLSRQVVVAVVEGQQARWNEQHTLILTDYTLRVESRLRGETADRVTLTMPGGTLGGKTHLTSLSVTLHKGERYLLFCRDLEQPQMAPITGTWQGVFREALRPDGMRGVVSGESAAEVKTSTGKAVSFPELVESVRELVRKAPSESIAVVPGWSAVPKNLPSKVYSPLAPPLDLEGAAADATAGLDNVTGRFLVLFRPDPPIIFNQLPDSFTPWSPEDRAMIAYWNVYAKNLFATRLFPTTTWAFGDGKNDIPGFVSDADMRTQFGTTWGGNILGVTYMYLATEEGPIIESDIILNPHFAWTTDEALASTPSSPEYSFRQVMLHELGHSWGLRHPWETQRVGWDSVMNYAPKQFTLPNLHADDTAAVRSAFPGTRLHDGLLSTYRTEFGLENHAKYTASEPASASVAAGDSFQMSQAITIENVGSDNLADPVIEVYLSPKRLSFKDSVFLTTVQYQGVNIPKSAVQTIDVGTLTVPRDTPGGTYAVTFFLRDEADEYQTNNLAWTSTFIQVQGDNNVNCNPDATTLCLDNQPGDESFKVTVDYSSQAGGGSATAIPLGSLGVFRGGLFWFFSADNPEMLVKVINGCAVNGHYWVFASAGTNVGLSMTVTDTRNGRQKNYRNDDGTPAAPIQDTQAFTCSNP